MSFSSFGAYEMLEAGDQSQSIQRLADARALSASVHYAKQYYQNYLNNAYDKIDFNDRLAAIMPDLKELVAKTSSIGHLDTVVEKLSWNFDKKKDDDDDSDSSDKKDDSDDKSDDSDDDSTPSFVDTDKSDDDDRDDGDDKNGDDDSSSKESRKQAMFTNAAMQLHADGFPKHLDTQGPQNPGWRDTGYGDSSETDYHRDPESFDLPSAAVTENSQGPGFEGSYFPGGVADPKTLTGPTQQHVMNQMEDQFPQVGAPGRHRASKGYPVVPRVAKKTIRTAADLPRVARLPKA